SQGVGGVAAEAFAFGFGPLVGQLVGEVTAIQVGDAAEGGDAVGVGGGVLGFFERAAQVPKVDVDQLGVEVVAPGGVDDEHRLARSGCGPEGVADVVDRGVDHGRAGVDVAVGHERVDALFPGDPVGVEGQVDQEVAGDPAQTGGDGFTVD